MSNLVDKKRFSLRSLILVMTAACLLLGAWSLYVDPYRKQANSLAQVYRVKGDAQIVAADGPGWQKWLVETMLGEESFVQVTAVNLSNCNVDDAVLKNLAGLRHLEELNLDRTQISDAGTATLASFPQLTTLSLRFTKAADGSADHIGALKGLEQLYLTSTQVSDASAEGLAKLTRLKELYVRWSRISDAGAEQLRHDLPKCKVYHNALVGDVASQ